eukprot:363006-Alexandrium_andersonii.AAC.1
MSARSLCVLCHFAALAGVDACKWLALSPGASSGHFQRKVDRALDLQAADAKRCSLDVPGQSREYDSRCTLN